MRQTNAPRIDEGYTMNEDFQTSWSEQASAPHSDSTTTTLRQASAVPVKQIVTIRLDVDMLNWFKSAGPGYQTRINQILRQHMDDKRAAGDAAD